MVEEAEVAKQHQHQQQQGESSWKDLDPTEIDVLEVERETEYDAGK